nr:LysE family translocator [uncultured Enterobacter sp.]
MVSLSSLIPAAFPLLALSHFVALLSPGSDFFLLIGYAIRYRLRGSIGLCAGIALGNAFYIVLAMLGWGGFRQVPMLFTLIELLGAGYLLWIGSQLLRSKPQALALDATESRCPSFFRQALLGLGSSLLNPKNAFFYLALMTSILGPDVTLAQQMFCGVWMTSAVLLWDVLVAATIGLRIVQQPLRTRIHLIERFAGVVLAGFGVYILLSGLAKL